MSGGISNSFLFFPVFDECGAGRRWLQKGSCQMNSCHHLKLSNPIARGTLPKSNYQIPITNYQCQMNCCLRLKLSNPIQARGSSPKSNYQLARHRSSFTITRKGKRSLSWRKHMPWDLESIIEDSACWSNIGICKCCPSIEVIPGEHLWYSSSRKIVYWKLF